MTKISEGRGEMRKSKTAKASQSRLSLASHSTHVLPSKTVLLQIGQCQPATVSTSTRLLLVAYALK